VAAKQLQLFAGGKLHVTLARLCQELIENHVDFSNSVMLGIQPRGVFLSRRIHEMLIKLVPGFSIPYGELDVTFHRDDVMKHDSPLQASETSVEFSLENKRVILVDDVLYTGRTVRAALDAMLAFGRPADVQLLVLVDRRQKRELPIEAVYSGIEVDTLKAEKVIVRLNEPNGKDYVKIEKA